MLRLKKKRFLWKEKQQKVDKEDILHKPLQTRLRGHVYSTSTLANLGQEFAIFKVTVRGQQRLLREKRAHMHIIRHMCFLWAGALGNMVVSRGQMCHADPISPGDALPRERRTGWRMSHAKVCTAFMRSTVLPRNPHAALGNHHSEACRCFLTFSEFTICKKFRKREISLQTQTSTMALKHFPVLSVKGMASPCWTVRPSKAWAVSFLCCC